MADKEPASVDGGISAIGDISSPSIEMAGGVSDGVAAMMMGELRSVALDSCGSKYAG